MTEYSSENEAECLFEDDIESFTFLIDVADKVKSIPVILNIKRNIRVSLTFHFVIGSLTSTIRTTMQLTTILTSLTQKTRKNLDFRRFIKVNATKAEDFQTTIIYELNLLEKMVEDVLKTDHPKPVSKKENNESLIGRTPNKRKERSRSSQKKSGDSRPKNLTPQEADRSILPYRPYTEPDSSSFNEEPTHNEFQEALSQKEEYNKLELVMQKYEGEIRSHIRSEQQLRLLAESLQAKLEEMEQIHEAELNNSKKQLAVNQKQPIHSSSWVSFVGVSKGDGFFVLD